MLLHREGEEKGSGEHVVEVEIKDSDVKLAALMRWNVSELKG